MADSFTPWDLKSGGHLVWVAFERGGGTVVWATTVCVSCTLLSGIDKGGGAGDGFMSMGRKWLHIYHCMQMKYESLKTWVMDRMRSSTSVFN